MSNIILELNNVNKTYSPGKRDELQVLKGIDLQVSEGEIIAIIGPSGVGKSTLLHIIGALDRPTNGQVEIDNLEIFSRNDEKLALLRNKTIGFVFQAHLLLPEFTALENVMMPAMISGQNRKEIETLAKNLLAEVGLAERLHHRPNELSGGEQQRVAVARALINKPRLLLADEPSGNLDASTADSLHQILWNVNKNHKQTLIVVTHNLELAKRADRVIELHDGSIKNVIKNENSN